MLRKTLGLGALVAGVLTLGNPAHANIILVSTTGTFTTDNQVQLYTFTLAQGGVFTATTFGFAGGTQVDGNVVAAGGFDPSLALFNSTGALIAQDDDSGDPTPHSCGASAVKSDGGSAFDACITLTLAAGSYTLALTEYDNDAIGPNITNGFEETTNNPGDPNFTGDNFGCSNGKFCDVNGDNRTSAFALDAVVPEPGTLPLLTAGIALLGMIRRRWSA